MIFKSSSVILPFKSYPKPIPTLDSNGIWCNINVHMLNISWLAQFIFEGYEFMRHPGGDFLQLFIS